MQKSTRWIATAIVGFSFLMTVGGGAQQERGQAPPPIKKHTYDLDSTYIRLPLAPGDQAYARIEGERLKQFVNEITGVSRKSRDDGEKFWGRIAGTKYDDMIEGWTEQKFKEFGLQNVNRQYFTLTPQFFPTNWSLTATGGGKSVTFATVRPAGRATTPAAGLDLDPVWVGLGTEADFAGRDVKGKLVFIHSVPTPAVISHSATWLGAAERAAKKGAAAILINLAILGTNYQMQMSGGVQGVPVLTIGYEDATALRTMIESGPVKVKALLVGETKSGLKDANVWGTLPGATDEEILIFAHHDAYFEGAIDNASGMAVMVGLAEYFSKIPQAQRRRTLKFVTTSGHHAGSTGVRLDAREPRDVLRQDRGGVQRRARVGHADLCPRSRAAAVEQHRGAAVVGLRQQEAGGHRPRRVPDVRRHGLSRHGRTLLRRQQRHSARCAQRGDHGVAGLLPHRSRPPGHRAGCRPRGGRRAPTPRSWTRSTKWSGVTSNTRRRRRRRAESSNRRGRVSTSTRVGSAQKQSGHRRQTCRSSHAGSRRPSSPSRSR